MKALLWILKNMTIHTRNLMGHPCDEYKKCHWQALAVSKEIGDPFYHMGYECIEMDIMWKWT